MNREKLAPCDCPDQVTADRLEHQGLGVNDDHIVVKPGVVELTIGAATLRIPMHRFKLFAKWYLEPQALKD